MIDEPLITLQRTNDGNIGVRVKEYARTQPHSKQFRLGYIRLG